MAAMQANRASEMDAWMSRYRAFAEGVVVMGCPVILAFALEKVKLKDKEHGFAIAISVLVAAAITLIAGILPFLICRWTSERTGSPRTVTKCLALSSGACLVVLGCCVHYIIFQKWTYPVIGSVIGFCLLIPTAIDCFGNVAAAANQERHYRILEISLEFAAGITALLFLGLEGLALEGQINSTKETIHRFTKPLGASFFTCVIGSCLMLLETTPVLISHRNIRGTMTHIFDFVLTCAIFLVMFFILQELTKMLALVLLVPPFLILLWLAFHLAIPINVPQPNGENYEPASLELTKVTFTGFLAVTIPSISKDSINKSTGGFVILSALAIVCGLVWRLLTHYQSHVCKKTARIASICTHVLIVTAVIPFTVMAVNALKI